MKQFIISLILITFNYSNIIQIPQQFPTIQTGIDIADSGDTVLVSHGYYQESIVINKSILLITENLFNNEENFSNETIISGTSISDYVCTILNDSTITIKMMGFTIEGGSSIAGVINGNNTNLILNQIDIENFNGNGINLNYSDIIMENIKISGEDNIESRAINYYYVNGNMNNMIIDNHNIQEFSSGMRILNSELQLNNIQIIGNVSYTGGAISAQNSNIILNQCLISNNITEIGNGGGIYLIGTISQIYESEIQANEAPLGGGINIQNSELAIENSIISDNYANEGAGIYSSNSELSINNSIIKNNTANEGGGISSVLSNISIVKSAINENTSAYRGGGISIANSNLTFSFSVITSNFSGQFANNGYFSNTQISALSSVIAPLDTFNQQIIFDGGEFICHYSVIPKENITEMWQIGLDSFLENNNINLENSEEDLFYLNSNFYPENNSLLIDNGSFYMINELDTLISIPPFEIIGIAPDIGIYEVDTSMLLGDLNNDMNIDIIDILLLKMNLDSITFQFPENANYNHDQSIDIIDLILILINILE